MMSDHAKLAMPVSERDHARGSLSAPLVLLEYGDYECPHCATAYPVVKELCTAFGAELTFVYRNFPLTNVHVHAQRAAETAEWAGLAERFWDMHDYLFEHHDRVDDRGLLAAAAALDLDARDLQHAWQTYRLIPRVKEDFLGGIESGVSGTPKFFINGRRHDGLATVAALSAALEAARGDRPR
jgi:protein-disulfide isomerase